jgi:hypothetical protein
MTGAPLFEYHRIMPYKPSEYINLSMSKLFVRSEYKMRKRGCPWYRSR